MGMHRAGGATAPRRPGSPASTVGRGSRRRGSIVRRSRITLRGGFPSVKLRAAVCLSFGLLLLSAVTAFAADAKPAAKPAAAKPAAPKPASSSKTAAAEKTPAAPVDSLTILEKKVAKDSTNFDNL